MEFWWCYEGRDLQHVWALGLSCAAFAKCQEQLQLIYLPPLRPPKKSITNYCNFYLYPEKKEQPKFHKKTLPHLQDPHLLALTFSGLLFVLFMLLLILLLVAAFCVHVAACCCCCSCCCLCLFLLFVHLLLLFSAFDSVCLSLCLLVEFWWCLKCRGPEMCAFGVLWLSCEAPAAPKPPGFHTTGQEPKRAHLSTPVFKNTTKIPREDTQRDKKRAKFWAGRSRIGRSRSRSLAHPPSPGVEDPPGSCS